MKSLLTAVLFGLLLSPVVAQTKAALGAKVVTHAATQAAQTTLNNEVAFNWAYAPNLSSCTTSNEACYSGFTMTFTNTNTVIATPTTLGPNALSYNWVPSGGLPYGTLNFSLVANGFDATGKAVVSAPATVSVVNNIPALAGPTNLQAVTATAQ